MADSIALTTWFSTDRSRLYADGRMKTRLTGRYVMAGGELHCIYDRAAIKSENPLLLTLTGM
jgi:hypothetical protein